MADQYVEDRRRKLEAIRELGIDPYGRRLDEIESNAALRARAEAADIEPGQMADHERGRATGRIMLLRNMGKLCFMTVRDSTGDLQFGLSKKALGADAWELVKQLDLGDLVAADGVLGRTKMGEITLWVDELRLQCKSLRPLPEKWHGLQDVEARYRQRYVDLFANPPVMAVFKQRSAIIEAVRQHLLGKDFLEVETPTLQPIYGGAAARPFTTHHNTLDIDLFMRISPELYLKRLMVGGIERVFELSRNFRNEGIDTQHNPEFTLLEIYQAYGDYHSMMALTEGMYAAAVEAIGGGTKRPFGDVELDFTPPWPRKSYCGLVEQAVGADIHDIDAVRARAAKEGINHQNMADDLVINALFEALVEPTLVQPTFVMDYPASLCPLTRRHPEDDRIALRFEAFAAGGMELGNAYTELNDPDIQRATLGEQVKGEGDETMRVMDEDFLRALEHGMPPAGGLGIGIDRMVMLLTNSQSIRDVILFPLQRPRA